ncbi:hypothetical protein TNCV_451 [Trichonephila clavipes]|nr:hypothetical protein TNCV_451 [Trichonephila clavipes]
MVPNVVGQLNYILRFENVDSHRIRQHNVSSKDMLKSVLKDQWEKLSAEKTPRFASSMPKRLQEAHK